MPKEQTFPILQTILDLKLAASIPDDERPEMRITVRNTEGDLTEEIDKLRLTNYEEHYFNGLEKVIFTLSHPERDDEEYEWQPMSESEEVDSLVTDITLKWQKKKPRLAEEKIRRFLRLLPQTYDQEEIEAVAKTIHAKDE